MTYSVFCDAQWLYPDSPHNGIQSADVHTAPGGHGAFFLLGDSVLLQTAVTADFSWGNGEGPSFKIFELLAVGVNENTSPTLMTTTDYESCRGFVTRRAPFYVYDALLPITGALHTLHTGRLALYCSLEASCSAKPGLYCGCLQITAQNGSAFSLRIPVRCQVHACRIPGGNSTRLSMLNFFNYEGISAQHRAAEGSETWWEIYRRYVRAQLDMRCTHILLPTGIPVKDSAGRLTGFDFSFAKKAGQIALEEGAPFLCGGHIAHWNEWTEAEYYPFWDSAAGITTGEGYLQLRLYFTAWAEVIRKNGWQKVMTQALADEPQVHNAKTYRILACIFRKFLPSIPIIDAVETTDLGGGIDIWVPKQVTYEKHREAFDRLKAAGETLWFYTCAFPAGNTMNRSMDLPLTVSRLVLWMGAAYRLSGFLHWGFNYYIGDDIWHSACCPHKEALLPAGDAHIVYPGPNGPLPSVRFEAQRAGAEEYELLMQLMDRRPEKAEAIIARVCASFTSYTADGSLLHEARIRLLTEAEKSFCKEP